MPTTIVWPPGWRRWAFFSLTFKNAGRSDLFDLHQLPFLITKKKKYDSYADFLKQIWTRLDDKLAWHGALWWKLSGISRITRLNVGPSHHHCIVTVREDQPFHHAGHHLQSLALHNFLGFIIGTCYTCAQVTIATVKTAVADVVVQKHVERKKQIDWRRTTAFAAFGFAFLGCVQVCDWLVKIALPCRLYCRCKRFDPLKIEFSRAVGTIRPDV